MTTKLARNFLLVGVSLVALAASAAEAGAVVFGFTDAVQTYVVPETGEYEIILKGAQGGSSPDGNAGGMGAVVGGDIFLKQNELLDIFVGGQGYGFNGYAGGGGGGTFLGNPKKVFFIAGGGGGGGAGDRSIADGRPGRSQRSASAGRGGNGGYGGSGGYGGEGGQDATGFNGGGGSGLNSYGGDGFYGKKGRSGYGGYTYFGGFPGGGFGGGGGGGFSGGGGGGGFSGGGGGTGGDKAGGGGGGGGGSFIIGRATDTLGLTGANSGNGYASIIMVPEPSTWAMILAGFSAMGVMLARRARAAKAA
jgi:PEP-CTERM motif